MTASRTKNNPLDTSISDSSKTQAPAKLTPMMAQWAQCKSTSHGALVLFRLGDFYEAFHEDAHIISQALDLTLTKRQEVPMCGIPWHSSESYVDRLIQKGFSVAIAEQVEPEKGQNAPSSKGSKAIMERKVVRILSPGTATTPTLLQDHNFHFIASIVEGASESLGISFIDISTGLFYVAEAKEPEHKEKLIQEIIKRRPKEIVISKQFSTKRSDLLSLLEQHFPYRKTIIEAWLFDPTIAYETLKHHFKLQTLDAFGLEGKKLSLSAGAALLTFIRDTLFHNVDHLNAIEYLETASSVQIDVATLRNLDIFDAESQRGDAKSLFDVLNDTKTPMGARLLRSRLLQPLLDVEKIQSRLNEVEAYLTLIAKEPSLAHELEKSLSQVRDIERLINRISSTMPSPRDVAYLSLCLKAVAQVAALLKKALNGSVKIIKEHSSDIPTLDAVIGLISNTIAEDPPLRIGDGGNTIRALVSSELDELRELKTSSEAWLLSYQTRLREELGIKTLKVGFSRAFGYFIEVSRGQSDKMPSTFSRRQTLTNGERFVSEELVEFEKKILSSEARIEALETELFSELVNDVRSFSHEIIRAAKVISEIDCSRALASVALNNKYTRPRIVDEPVLDIASARHPVAESLFTTPFTPNDLKLHADTSSFLMITGPNMGGKSTYIRQAALIVIMAQIGSFVPASSATIGVVDKVFSRVGASDDLAKGQSTFMVEMTETAHILHTATDRSLILLDEIGRGTSTYDGLSIAWAVTEFLTKSSKRNPRTLFATHYHELTKLESTIPCIRNMTVAVSETEQGIQFLYKIIQGKADKSYGIHVAELAGIPRPVIQRAQEILSHLETSSEEEHACLEAPISMTQIPPRIPGRGEQDLFGANPLQKQELSEAQRCLNFITSLDLLKLTPLDCFMKVARFYEDLTKKKAR